jgi:alkylation response protein AidB-like acyl-CoA dehydrogenase
MLDSKVLDSLKEAADECDASAEWPAASWNFIRQAGALAWSVPRDSGGDGKSAGELLTGYEQLAAACMTTAFILSQREAAVRRLAASPNRALAHRYLPRLASGEIFATVGLSQLTTSRQHQAPILTALETADGYHLNGLIPWVTGADHAEMIVVGATLEDGRQLLLALPRQQLGVTIDPPLPLMALAGSQTSVIRLSEVVLGRDCLIAGPAEKIMAGKPGGVGGLETSCLALGLAGAAIDYVADEASRRSDLTTASQRLQETRLQLRSTLQALAQSVPAAELMVTIRVECTLLALQASQVAMAVAKGTGFVAPHPVQRWARQALFFLVWSCPRPAAEGMIGHLLPDSNP